MPSIKTREIEIEIISDDPAVVADLYRVVMRERAGTAGASRVSTTVSYRDTTDLPSEYETILATQGPAPAPPALSDPDLRERQREAASRARDALAAQRRLKAEETAAKDATDSATKAAQMAGDGEVAPPAPKPRGRPRKVTSPAPTALDDLSGDEEDGDLERTPDTEPADYGEPEQPGTSPGALTPEQQREQCLMALRAVAETEAPGVLDAIKQHVRSFGTAKILEVPLTRMEEFWIATASLCAIYSVPFPATPATH